MHQGSLYFYRVKVKCTVTKCIELELYQTVAQTPPFLHIPLILLGLKSHTIYLPTGLRKKLILLTI